MNSNITSTMFTFKKNSIQESLKNSKENIKDI